MYLKLKFTHTTRLTILFLLITNMLIGQTINRFQSNFDLQNDVKKENVINAYNKFDFSSIWTKTDNVSIYGIIGSDHQRIKMKLISVAKNDGNPNEYIVSGKSSVKENVCDFTGTITLMDVREVKEMHFGVDEMYIDKGVKAQGIVMAKYEFSENKEQNHSGVFSGILYAKWYVNSKGELVYDDIEDYCSAGFAILRLLHLVPNIPIDVLFYACLNSSVGY